ncbi:MAG: hypothetical protein ACXVFN_12960 [Solirubrobacteraceae bacterium]
MLVTVAAAAAGGGPASAATTCPPFTTFDPANFHNPTRIDNTFLPMTPGTQTTLDGRSNVNGAPLPHRVTFTVTDLTKVVDGVQSVVVWDVDSDTGQVVESELAFFAQDDSGTVWNLGEYPEEYTNGTFSGAPSTWIGGLSGAEPGVHMPGQPKVTSTFYLQGSSPDISFLDCARVAKTGQTETVPFGSFQNVLETYEKSPLDPTSGIQTKFHAPGLGIVKVGAINDPEGETLVLTNLAHLDAQGLADARQSALALDSHGYQVSPIYAQTAHAEGPPPPPPPPQPQPQPAPQPAPTTIAVAGVTAHAPALTVARVRARVRRALLARLPGWKITRLACVVRNGRASCRFVARRRQATLRGIGTVTRRASDGALRYRLIVQITRAGCHPAASGRCTRRAIWAS